MIDVTKVNNVSTYDVQYNGQDYAIIVGTDINIGHTETGVLCDGEPVEGELLNSILEAFYNAIEPKSIIDIAFGKE